MLKLYTNERKVLTILEQDCRMRATKIAKLCHLSPEGVIKIINRMKERKIIRKFNAKINYSRIGYKLIYLMFKLTQRDAKTIEQIKQLLLSNKTYAWHMFTEGEYDLLLSLKIIEEHDNTAMESLLSSLAKYYSEKDVSIVQSSYDIGSVFYGKGKKAFKVFDYTTEKILLTEKETALIGLLKKDSRATALELARKLSTTPRIVTLSIKNLIKKGVISGFKSELNVSLLGFQPCNALISFGEYSEKDWEKLKSWCFIRPQITYFLAQVGKYDVEIAFDVLSVTEFYTVIDEMREKFPFIKKITTLIAKEY